MRSLARPHILRRAGMPAVVSVVLLVSGCGAGDADPAAGPTATSTGSPAAAGVVLDLTGTEYSFSPSAAKASAGKTTIRFTNKGAMEHDYVIKALNVNLVAQPGKTAEVTVILKPGTYQSLCSVPGHSQSGMQGTLIVS